MKRCLLVLLAVPVWLLATVVVSAQADLLLEPIEILDPSLSATVDLVGQNGGCNTGAGSAICHGPFGDSNSMVLADGSLLALESQSFNPGCGLTESYTSVFRTTPTGVGQEVLRLHTMVCTNCQPGGCTRRREISLPLQFRLDPVSGILYLRETVIESWPGQPTTADSGLVRISGLPTLLDTLLTFVPGQQALTILTPAMPDGFRSPDSLQVWTGDIRSMPDWSQADPLTCEAAAGPQPGQVVSVTDTLPDPAVGEGRYYLVASQSGPDRRLGRQYVNRAFSAREPATLPACE